ncbi:NAD-dependent succinate-semialdehyde dehydrogenase [Microbacterium ulmi]|uniref:NAD-dependent succinate-semialdehyde dehydrogenase n=1 Tax=Microbacterium ulmi TaxID=179095 RepID=A0A7Y2M1Y8_9MICO|nr:NAD-dependent succinate-semialdehyde dehydrogenase [Microbacterium ulmi]NII69270.1 succinate-semialdehyde dehydrogenase/glutarate-semialdehyde dehydrogenase [Microbacterium ulmi]NNH04949.1 NAD-dependent succinate-semialdehyde dehydrogenase [Microbacterium ulmi]
MSTTLVPDTTITTATFPVVNPADGSVVATVPDSTPEDAERALDAARAASASWAALPQRERSGILLRAFSLMIERRDELATLITRENGKARPDALAEVAYAAEYFRWYAEQAVRVRGELFDSPSGSNKVLVTHEPVGVCVLVTPWNFPAAMATRKIAPALAVGCTAILKPAAETPLTAIAIAGILAEAGLPDGVLTVLPTTRAGRLVDRLLEDEDVRMLSFTGSTEVGRHLLERASRRVLRTAMELGGNAPFVVLDDADLDAALDGALVAKMRNAGQACTAANRFYVHDDLHDAFAAALAERMSAQRVGDGIRPEIEVGPLINAEARDKVHELVEDAVARGARVLTGGAPVDGPGFFYAPTVLVDVPADARILREEVFGPVAPIVRFSSADDAIEVANDTIHGLVSYLYTGDLARGLALAGRLQAGMVALNRGLVSDPAAPFGGVKESGLGREGSTEGLHEYLETKYVATTW